MIATDEGKGVHGVTVLLGVAGILLVVLGWGGALPVLGVFLLALAWVLRPRFGRPPGRGPLLHRAAAPRLFALVDEVASVTGTTGVDVIVLTADVNASVTPGSDKSAASGTKTPPPERRAAVVSIARGAESMLAVETRQATTQTMYGPIRPLMPSLSAASRDGASSAGPAIAPSVAAQTIQPIIVAR